MINIQKHDITYQNVITKTESFVKHQEMIASKKETWELSTGNSKHSTSLIGKISICAAKEGSFGLYINFVL